MTSDARETFEALLERAMQQESGFEKNRIEALERVSGLASVEKSMLSQIVAGWSNQEIADYHGLEPHAYKAQRQQLFEKINAVSTSAAVRTGIYAGL